MIRLVDDSSIVALVAEESDFQAPMAELDRKGRYFASTNLQRSRDFEGKARR